MVRHSSDAMLPETAIGLSPVVSACSVVNIVFRNHSHGILTPQNKSFYYSQQRTMSPALAPTVKPCPGNGSGLFDWKAMPGAIAHGCSQQQS